MAPARKISGLSCDESFRSAAGKIIWTRFQEMMSFADAALEGSDPEGVHDMRVASRRLRAALELFQDVFPVKQLAPFRRGVKELADTLGEVRDLDVLIERLEADQRGRPPSQRLVLQEMIEELRADRAVRRKTLKEALGRIDRSDFSRHFLTFVARETA